MVTRGPSQVRVAGPLAPHADGFRASLDAQGFSPWSQMFYLHLLADLSRWLGRHGLDASGLTDANASAFRRDRRSRGRARFRGTQGLALLLSFLRDAGAAPSPAAQFAHSTIAGVYIHATAVNNLIDRNALVELGRWLTALIASNNCSAALRPRNSRKR